MAVVRISPNLLTDNPEALAAFYAEVFEMEVQADIGWIAFLRGAADSPTTLQIAREGGSGTDLPVMTLEVDDLDATLARLRIAGHEPVYGPVVEPLGVRRFFISDPAGHLVNVAIHVD